MNALEIEMAVAEHFNYRQNIIVPNVSWGLFISHMEADMIIVRPSGWAIEIEIKISKGDIKRDQKKWHRLRSNIDGIRNEMIRQTYFAIPDGLKIEDIPEWSGILKVKKVEDKYHKTPRWVVSCERSAKIYKLARKLKTEEINKLLHLGCMRIWSLKKALMNAKNKKHNGS